MKITDAQLKQIYAHAKETYPHECCGFLLGDFDSCLVRVIHPTANQNQAEPDRFVISPQDYMKAQNAADDAGLDIIGVYHSHPDWPPIPSQTDMDSAFENNFYLIVSVHEGRPLNTNVWRLAEEGLRRFEGMPLEIIDAREFESDE